MRLASRIGRRYTTYGYEMAVTGSDIDLPLYEKTHNRRVLACGWLSYYQPLVTSVDIKKPQACACGCIVNKLKFDHSANRRTTTRITATRHGHKVNCLNDDHNAFGSFHEHARTIPYAVMRRQIPLIFSLNTPGHSKNGIRVTQPTHVGVNR